jgi:hypothetical protein
MDRNEEREVVKLPARRARGLGRPIVGKVGPVRVEVMPARSKGPSARPWEPLGAIDVEQLVVWAFRDQKADRHAGVGLHRIEANVAGLEPRGRSSDGCAALSDIEHLGCRIDRRAGLVRDLVHPVAEAVAVEASALAGGELLRFYGRLGGRPDGWAEPQRWYRPVVWVKPGEEAQWERTGRGNSPRFCRVIPTVTREDIVRRRATYSCWWEALDRLAWTLSMRALGFVVSAPAAPREPWAPGSDGDAGVDG